MKNELPLVDFETAKLLKEKGFRADTNTYFHVHLNQGVIEEWDFEQSDYNSSYSWHYSRPTVSLAIRWLLLSKGYYISIYPSSTMSVWHVRLHNNEGYENLLITETTYDLAESAALLHALKLIQ